MATDRKKLENNERYLEKLERIVFRVHKDGSDGITKQSIQEAADREGKSANAWIVGTLRRALEELVGEQGNSE